MAILSRIKPLAETTLVRSGLSDVVRAIRGARRVVLAFHNVVPDGRPSLGDTSLHLPLGRFRRQLDLLVRKCRVVGLDEILDPDPGDGRPLVAITFDDGYRGALTLGVSELLQRELPATFFVSPGLLGNRTFWWDVVLDRVGRNLGGLSRQVAIEQFRGDQGEVREWARRCRFGVRAVPSSLRSVTVAELRTVAEKPGIRIGSHGWSHRNLTTLPAPEALWEMESSLAWLRRELDRPPVTWISYPYGLSNPDVEDLAAAAGYRGGLRVDGRSLGRGRQVSGLHALPRLNVSRGLSPEGLALRISGVVES